MQTDYKANQLLDYLETQGVERTKELEQFTISTQGKKELPLYVRGFIGFGAFVSSVCFVSFLGLINFLDFRNEFVSFIQGTVFVLLALLWVKLADKHSSKQALNSFLVCFSFTFMAIGKIMIIGSLMSFWGNTYLAISLALFFVGLSTYHFYDFSIDRFGCLFLGFIFLGVDILNKTQHKLGGSFSVEIIWVVYYLPQLYIVGRLAISRRLKRKYLPAFYAILGSLVWGTVLILNLNSTYLWSAFYFSEKYPWSTYIISLGFGVAFLVVLFFLLGKAKFKKISLLTIILTCFLVYFQLNGVLLALSILTIGYSRHSKLLDFVGVGVLVIYLITYYYQTSTTLLEKSGSLILSGIIVLGICYYLNKLVKLGESDEK